MLNKGTDTISYSCDANTHTCHSTCCVYQWAQVRLQLVMVGESSPLEENNHSSSSNRKEIYHDQQPQ